MSGACPFCERISESSDAGLAVAFADAFPLAEGHTLVVPRRHVATPFELDDDEWAELFALTRRVLERLRTTSAADGFNVGINVGAAAGQTVEHLHVHVIPRVEGDVPDPRGGVRWVVPDRAAYWERGS